MITLSDMLRIAGIDDTDVQLIHDTHISHLGPNFDQRSNLLVYVEESKWFPVLNEICNIAAIITTPDLVAKVPTSMGLLTSRSPRLTFFQIHNALARCSTFYGEKCENEIDSSAVISPHATIAENNVRIGARCVIEPHVVIHENSILGEDVIVRAGTIIGGQGFEFKRIAGQILPVAHTGGVKLGARVEIQYNTVVDRGIFGENTEVGDDTKIDNLIQIAHAAKIGCRCLIAAGAVISGSSVIGDDVWIGPGAVISNKVVIGNRAMVRLGSVVIKNVVEDGDVSGNFAATHRTTLQHWWEMRREPISK